MPNSPAAPVTTTNDTPVWEDPTVVAYQFTRALPSGKVVLKAIERGPLGKQLAITAGEINSGLNDRSLIAFPCKKGGCIIRQSSYEAGGTESSVA